MRRRIFSAIVVVTLPQLAGCAHTDARYVYQDGQFGVVGIPQNTAHWPHNYRAQAEELMAAHFPEGYEVVRAEEVVEGSRTLTVDGSTKAEIQPQLPTALLKVGTLGRTASKKQSDQVKIKECRIVYKKAGGPKPGAFASEPGLSPTPYVDPNAEARELKGARVAKARAGKERDDEAKPARLAKAEKEKDDEEGEEGSD